MEKTYHLSAKELETETKKLGEKPVAEDPQKKEKNKNRTKAAGLKSVLADGTGRIIMTSFGKKSAATIEKIITNNEIKNIPDEPAFSVTHNKPNYEISNYSNKNKAAPNSPLQISLSDERVVGQDILGNKDVLEKRFFGKTFENENMHIQLAYNILDIEKILAVHINNIVYAVNNMFRGKGKHTEDFIGQISLKNTYANYKAEQDLPFLDENANRRRKASYQSFKELVNRPQLAYFGDAFYIKNPNQQQEGQKKWDEKPLDDQNKILSGLNRNDPKYQKKLNEKIKNLAPEYIPKSEKNNYYMLACLGFIRQFCAHNAYDAGIYTLDTASAPQYIEAMEALKRLYDTRMSKVDRDFINLNTKGNFRILFKVLNALTPNEKSAIVKLFYTYTVNKEHKYLGFSIKNLREELLTAENLKHLAAPDNKRVNTYRGKLYTLADFCIYHYYATKGVDRGEHIVDALRACAGNEDKKSQVYAEETKIIHDKIAPLILSINNEILNTLNKDKKGVYKIGKDNTDYAILENAVHAVSRVVKTNGFCMLINLMTYFINGKEINDLLTQLISKFKDIDSMANVIKQLSTDSTEPIFPVGSKYAMFNDSKAVYESLELILSVSRMQRPISMAKRVMYVEAAKILGIDATEAELENEISAILDVNGIKAKKPNKNFRNFIATNVIESSRFHYLVRYGNPNTLRALAKNEKLIAFVLKRLPPQQIERYYKSCGECVHTDTSSQITYLTEKLVKLSFNDFENVVNDDRKASPYEKQNKAKKQAVLTLYLTVLYQIVKNLVYVNSRYFLAFHCLERDMSINNLKLNAQTYRECFYLTKKHIADIRAQQEKRRNTPRPSNPNKTLRVDKNKLRICHYLEQDLNNSSQRVIKLFRNQVEHLATVYAAGEYVKDIARVDSYFALYHYLLQQALVKQLNDEVESPNIPTTREDIPESIYTYSDAVTKHKTYCTDFVKALCIAFGYNNARFKNLSVEVCFDRNEQPAKK